MNSILLKHLLATSLVFLFIWSFTLLLQQQWDLIFLKELHGYDEHANTAVTGNLTRLSFPAKLRINSLTDIPTGYWMEDQYWQHIPPLFAYVPLPFYLLDGQVSIEIYRLSYAMIQMLTGIVLIVGVYLFHRSLI